MYTADPPLLIARVKDAHRDPSGVCCSVLQCGAAWCGVLQCVAAYHDPSGGQKVVYRVISKHWQNFHMCMVFFIILFMGRWWVILKRTFLQHTATHCITRSLSPSRHLSMTMSRTFLLSTWECVTRMCDASIDKNVRQHVSTRETQWQEFVMPVLTRMCVSTCESSWQECVMLVLTRMCDAMWVHLRVCNKNVACHCWQKCVWVLVRVRGKSASRQCWQECGTPCKYIWEFVARMLHACVDKNVWDHVSPYKGSWQKCAVLVRVCSMTPIRIWGFRIHHDSTVLFMEICKYITWMSGWGRERERDCLY